MRGAAFVLALTLAAAPAALSAWGCSSHATPGAAAAPDAADAAAADADASGCPSGFAPLQDAGAGCSPILPSAPCEAGTAPSIGSTACAPVGESQCPAGFATHASGWGCDAVLPATACAGATIDTLGMATCAPLPDCSAPFPPAGATLFVSASYTPAQLDAAHFLSVQDALASAPNGAVIAVDVGSYTGTIAPTLGVSIVGRCASGVVFQATDPTTSALEIQGGQVSVSNLSLLGYHGTVSVLGGTVTLDSVVVDQSAYTGIAIGNAGTKVTLNQVVVRGTRAGPTDDNAFGLYVGDGAEVIVTSSVFADNDYINVALSGSPSGGASLTMTGSIVRDGHPLASTDGFGWGVYASEKVTLTVADSAIVDNQGFGLSLYATETKASPNGTITGSVVRGTTFDPVNGAGYGVEATASTADIEQSTLADNDQVDVYFANGATGKLVSSSLVGTSSTDPTVLGPLGLVVHGSTATVQGVAIANARAGAEIEGASTASISGSIIQGSRTSPSGYYVNDDYVGVGLFAETGAHVTLQGSVIDATHTAGILTLGHTTATGLLVQGTLPGGDGVGGRGVSAQSGAVVSLTNSAFLDNTETGVLAAVDAASLELVGSVVDQTSFDPSGSYGIGVLFDDTATGTITSTTLRRSAGPALAVSGSGATVQSCVFADNSVAVFVQDGTSLVEADDAGAPLTLDISTDTVFVGNQTRVGSGVLALPSPLTQGP